MREAGEDPQRQRRTAEHDGLTTDYLEFLLQQRSKTEVAALIQGWLLDIEQDIRNGHPIAPPLRDLAIAALRGGLKLPKQRGPKREAESVALDEAIVSAIEDLDDTLPETRNDASEPISKLDAIAEAARRLGRPDLNYESLRKRVNRARSRTPWMMLLRDPGALFLPPWSAETASGPPPNLWDMFPQKTGPMNSA